MKWILILLLLPLLAKAQTEGQVQIWHNGAWVYQDAGFQYTVLDTANVTSGLATHPFTVTTNAIYRVSGWVNLKQVSKGLVITCYYTSPDGVLQRQGLGTFTQVGGHGLPVYEIKCLIGSGVWITAVPTGTVLFDFVGSVHN